MATTTELDNVFHVYTHHTQASHLRTYRGSSRDEGRPFTIELKQYVPRANTDPKPGDVTMIAAPGIGFPKVRFSVLVRGHLLTLLVLSRNVTSHCSRI